MKFFLFLPLLALGQDVPESLQKVMDAATNAANEAVATSTQTIQRLDAAVKGDLNSVKTAMVQEETVTAMNLVSLLRVFGMITIISTLFISFIHVIRHLKQWSAPSYQKHAVRILFLVPVFAIMSFIAMMLPRERSIFDLFRDTYEAFAMYSFLMLQFEYLGGVRLLTSRLSRRDPVPWFFPLNKVLPPIKPSSKVLNLLRFGVLQFVFFVPFCSLSGICIRYIRGDIVTSFSLSNPSIWVYLLQSSSISVAMNSLCVFYLLTKDLLTPFRPLLKFLSIKLVVFFPYWQNFFILGAVYFGLIPDYKDFSSHEIRIILEEALICFELLPIALLHFIAFPPQVPLHYGRTKESPSPLPDFLVPQYSACDIPSSTKDTASTSKTKRTQSITNSLPSTPVLSHDQWSRMFAQVGEALDARDLLFDVSNVVAQAKYHFDDSEYCLSEYEPLAQSRNDFTDTPSCHSESHSVYEDSPLEFASKGNRKPNFLYESSSTILP